MEIRPIPGFDGYYARSDGSILSTRRGYEYRVLRGSRHEDGYLVITLRENGKRQDIKAHRLVASAFFGPSDKVIRHLDGNPRNNCIENIVYGTMKENAYDRAKHGRWAIGSRRRSAKLSEESVRAIKQSLKSGISYSELGRTYNVTAGTIRYIATGRNWSHVSI